MLDDEDDLDEETRPLERARAGPRERSRLRRRSPAARGGSLFADFFAFRWMVSPVLIRVFYVLGALAILVSGLMMILALSPPTRYGHYSRHSSSDGWVILSAIAWIVLGNLLWRVICECWMLFFGIHDRLRAIEDGVGRQSR